MHNLLHTGAIIDAFVADVRLRFLFIGKLTVGRLTKLLGHTYKLPDFPVVIAADVTQKHLDRLLGEMPLL